MSENSRPITGPDSGDEEETLVEMTAPPEPCCPNCASALADFKYEPDTGLHMNTYECESFQWVSRTPNAGGKCAGGLASAKCMARMILNRDDA